MLTTQTLLHDLPRIGTCGRQREQDGEWHDARRALYDWEWLGFGPGAECEIRCGDQVHHCSGGSWIIIPPACWHVCSGTIPDTSWRLWVHFEWGGERGDGPRMVYAPGEIDYLELATERPDFPEGVLSGTIANPGALAGIHARIAHHFRLGSEHDHLLASTALIELLSACCPKPKHRANSDADILDHLRARLSALATEPFASAQPIRETVAACGQSYDHLAKRFRQCFGITPLQFVNAQRMSRAQRLISESDLTIHAIADQLGFDDAAYFSRLYKQVHGVSPKQDRISP